MSTEPLESLDKTFDFGTKIIKGSIGLSIGALILGSTAMFMYVARQDFLNYVHSHENKELTRPNVLNTNNLPHYVEYKGIRYYPNQKSQSVPRSE